MTESKKIEIKEKFTEIERLLLVEVPRDPPTEPYKSKYAAREKLIELKEIILEDDVTNEKVAAMLAHLWLQLGIISVETDELSRGEEEFNHSIDLMRSKETDPLFVIICISVFNNLGLLWSNREDWEKSAEFFERAEKCYNCFKSSLTSMNQPIDPASLFKNETALEDGVLTVEKLYTLTLFYYAQCYIHKKEPIKSAICCHTTLNRQLKYNNDDWKKTPHLKAEWCINIATLSQVCIENNAFHLGRECLYAASKFYEECKPYFDCIKNRDDQKYKAMVEKFVDIGIHIDRCWAKYGLNLLLNSRYRLMSDDDSESMKEFDPPDELKALKLDVDVLSEIPSPITTDYLLTYADAIKVFNTSLEHLNKAKAHYSLSEHATDHTKICQEISQLYKALEFFVESETDKCKIHKKRINELENVVKELNPQYYIIICREIWYELGEIYQEMYQLKFELMQKSNRPTPHQVAKINCLIKGSLTSYIDFIQSFKDIKTNEYPSKFADEWETPILRAFFFSARLLSKIIPEDKVQMRKNLIECLDNYKYIINYCAQHKSAEESMKTELPLCKQLVEILPFKIAKLTEQ